MRERSALPVRTAMIAIAGAALALATPRANAQSLTDARWQPWIGCWQPADPLAPSVTASIMCVVPADGGVDVAGISDGKVTSREHVVADGARHATTRDGCTGTQQAQFSNDSRWVYLNSEYTCAALHRATSGMLAMTTAGEWLDIQSVKVGASADVRAIHYRDAGVPASLPSEIAQAISGRTLAVATARSAAAGTIDVHDVVDASKHADTAVVQTWLAQRGGLPFEVDAGVLTTLADAGVPGSVTDLLVALGYPRTFAVQPGGAPDLLTPSDSARVAAQYLWGRGLPVDPFGLNYWDMYALRYGMYGYPYYGYGYGYSRYDPYGYNYGYGPLGYHGGAPVVVVRGARPQHGKVENGRGYTRRRGDDGGTAQPTTSRSPSSGSTRSSGGGHTSTGRTAHRRP